MEEKDPDFAARVREIFRSAPFVELLGIQMTGVGPGWCESEMALSPQHGQSNGFVHAGVQATLADHTAGAAAGSLAGAQDIVLSVEFKLNLLRAARGERLRCRAEVLKPGRTLCVVESSVFALTGTRESLVSKATVTLMMLQTDAGTA